MLVSIIIPIYNVAPFIGQCLKSVATQNYAEEVECLLIDDCGTDDSMFICKRFIEQYNGPIQFRILHHKHNQGLSSARNTGIYNAQGDWIFFLDSDDWIYEDCISSMLAVADKYPSADIIQGSFRAQDEKQNLWLHSGYDIPLDKDYLEDSSQCRMHLQKIGCLAMMQNRLIKKSFILNNHIFLKEGIIHEDNLWTFMAGKYVRHIAYCKNDTYYYRANPSGIIASSGKEAHAKSYSVVCDEILKKITLGRWFNLELNYLLWRIQSIEKYGYYDPFVFMHYANNEIVRKLYEIDKLAVRNHIRYSKRYRYKRAVIKSLLYLNVLCLRLSGTIS